MVNDEEDVLAEDEYRENLTESNNDKESDTEDAVSFLKNVKREPVDAGDACETFNKKAVKKNHACNYCKKRFLRKSNLVDHLRLHANVIYPYRHVYTDMGNNS